jgi:hypothetical protein
LPAGRILTVINRSTTCLRSHRAMVSHPARMSSAAMSAVTGDSHSRADPVLQVVNPLDELLGPPADRGGGQQPVGISATSFTWRSTTTVQDRHGIDGTHVHSAPRSAAAQPEQTLLLLSTP